MDKGTRQLFTIPALVVTGVAGPYPPAPPAGSVTRISEVTLEAGLL